MKRIYLYIAGNDASFSFEHRVFNLSSFIITLFCIQGTLFNYFLGLHLFTVWLAIAGTLVSAVLFYLSRLRKWFTPATIFIYVGITMLALGGMHFFNGASSSPVFYLIIMLQNIFLLIAQRKHQLLIYGLLAGTIMLLLVLEYFFPGWTVPYASPEERMVDHITTLAYSPFFTMVIIMLFRRSYDREQKIVLQQKQKLEEAYRITTEKNEYIESLIRELHHRVKNNLQIVSSLLSLQSNRVADDKARLALEEGKTRVDAMAMIHQKLYMDNELASVNIEEYLGHLSASLANSFGYDAQHVHMQVQLSNRSMDIDLAIPIGLIVNELITNAFKHAFQGVAQPAIKLTLLEQPDHLELTVADNGRGLRLPEGLESPGSFGMKLVQTLVEQVNGAMTVRQHPGTTYTIEIRA
ncbi:sensor histidine kinase [Chitinophaga japonensis]|uniref:histidine kinase n=1 Tax=Chitinophaga japonensis TaxID=104662 RepID=A0A562SYW5_CHIJA|nr:sensor histidine kinase [Chitinophaga japonensis]TWI86515.1 two-component sensor histidine kinase [Chitinophaga japonensis]